MRLSAALLFCLTACDQPLPCQNCPSVAGHYQVAWADSGSGTASCLVGDPFVTKWHLEQRGAQVSTTIDGVALVGTVYETFDTLLSGGQGSRYYRLEALVIPQSARADAGALLQGTFTARGIRDSGIQCEVAERFSATHVEP